MGSKSLIKRLGIFLPMGDAFISLESKHLGWIPFHNDSPNLRPHKFGMAVCSYQNKEVVLHSFFALWKELFPPCVLNSMNLLIITISSKTKSAPQPSNPSYNRSIYLLFCTYILPFIIILVSQQGELQRDSILQSSELWPLWALESGWIVGNM